MVRDVEVVKQLIEEANTRRSTGSTAANADSSRSHSIMQFALKRFIAGGAHCRQVSSAAWHLQALHMQSSCCVATNRKGFETGKHEPFVHMCACYCSWSVHATPRLMH